MTYEPPGVKAVDADKLDGYDSVDFTRKAENATVTGAWNFAANPTSGGNVMWHSGNDGPGSLLDADVLDGYHAVDFPRKAEAATITGNYTFSGLPSIVRTDELQNFDSSWWANHRFAFKNTDNSLGGGVDEIYLWAYNKTAATGTRLMDWNADGSVDTPGPLRVAGNPVFHAGNTGAGSGMNADLLDGYDSADFPRKAEAATVSSVWNFSANPTVNGFANWHGGNHGAGSGLDADKLDGYDSAAFPRKAEVASISGKWTFTDGIEARKSTFGADPNNGSIEIGDSTTGGGSGVAATTPFIDWHFGVGAAEDYNIRAINNGDGILRFQAPGTKSAKLEVNGGRVWHAGNDGAGSTLDADLLDNYDSAAFPRKSEAATITGSWTVNNTLFMGANIDMKGFSVANVGTLSGTHGEIGIGTGGAYNFDAKATADFRFHTGATDLMWLRRSGAVEVTSGPVTVGGRVEADALDRTSNTVSVTGAHTAKKQQNVLADATTAALTVTLPTPDTNVEVFIKKTDSSANAVTIAPPGTQTIDGQASITLSGQYAGREIISDGTNYFIAGTT